MGHEDFRALQHGDSRETVLQRFGVRSKLQEIKQRVSGRFPKVAMVSRSNERYDAAALELAWGKAFSVQDNEITYERRSRGLRSDGYREYSSIIVSVIVRDEAAYHTNDPYYREHPPERTYDIRINDHLIHSHDSPTDAIDELENAFANPRQIQGWESDDRKDEDRNRNSPSSSPIIY